MEIEYNQAIDDVLKLIENLEGKSNVAEWILDQLKKEVEKLKDGGLKWWKEYKIR